MSLASYLYSLSITAWAPLWFPRPPWKGPATQYTVGQEVMGVAKQPRVEKERLMQNLLIKMSITKA